MPLVYVRDVAEAVLLASRVDGAEGRTYLLVNDEPVTQRQYLTAIRNSWACRHPGRIPYRMALLAGTCAEGLGKLARPPQPPPVTRYGIQLLGGENRFDISGRGVNWALHRRWGTGRRCPGAAWSGTWVESLVREKVVGDAMQRVSLTGGNCFVGRHMVSALQDCVTRSASFSARREYDGSASAASEVCRGFFRRPSTAAMDGTMPCSLAAMMDASAPDGDYHAVNVHQPAARPRPARPRQTCCVPVTLTA